MPNKAELHIANVSEITGASCWKFVQYTHIPINTNQPVNPDTLFELIPLSAVNILIINSFIYYFFHFAALRAKFACFLVAGVALLSFANTCLAYA